MATAARMVPVASMSHAFEAKLLVARLGAEGIVCEVRGSVDGVYPLGPFEILVEEDAFETARVLLDVPFERDDLDEEDAGPGRWSRSSRLFILLVVVAAVLFLAMRMFSIG